jgi:hypothetical protein
MLDNQQIDHLQREKLLIERAVFRYERFARGIDGAEVKCDSAMPLPR